MIEPITIEKIRLSGFRAYLEPKVIDLGSKRGPLSLAVFAPNGKGKSSLVDSLEYYFSRGGTLEILGQKATGTKGGISALRHVDAEKYKRDTSVHIWFKQGSKKFDSSRPIRAPLTDAAETVLGLAKVQFVIRGYKLRRFIDEAKPVDRYRELVTWFEMEPLFDVQENLRILKGMVTHMVADQSDTNERLRDIKRITNGAVSSLDEQVLLDWINGTLLAALDKYLRLGSLSDGDPAFLELERREDEERKVSGLDTLRKQLGVIDDLRGQPATPQETSASRIASFEAAVLAFGNAMADAEAARTATSESKFIDVWQSAKQLLDDNGEMDKCPVCSMDFTSSRLGSRKRVLANLRDNIAKLKEYRRAEEARKSAKGELVLTKRNLDETLGNLFLLFDSGLQHKSVGDYNKVLKSWKVGGEAPDSKSAVGELTRLRESVSASIERIEQRQGERTYGKIIEKIRSLLDTKAELERIRRTKAAQKAIQDSLGRQANAFGDAIVKHVRSLLDELQNETSALYKGIQGASARVPQIHIKLADEGSANQRSAQLLIDFADNRREVAPGGFLSDSQIHTLALSLRLAAIRMFNAGVKIIALDDIVTSYDADRRKNIAAVMSDRFDDFQVIIVTHDETFFRTLSEQLPQSRWQFKRIKELRNGIGPIFSDHKTSDERIEKRLASGESAANDMRIAEEEWLTRICYEFKTPTVFQRAKHTSGTLARSLDRFLKDCELEPPKIPGNSNPFILSLQNSTVENLSSHFNDNAYENASIGDMEYRWDEFKRFRDLFVCPNCNHSHFERPNHFPKPVCAKCKTQFSFGCQASQTS